MPNQPGPLSDPIHIEQLEISARSGVLDEDRLRLQRLTLGITFWPYHGARDLEDRIENTINYSTVAEAATNFVRDQSVNLIETLADGLATHLLGSFAIQKIEIELRKFALPDAKYASITVTRTASVN